MPASLVLLLLAALAVPAPVRAALPAGTIAFVHEDSGSTDPLAQIFNLRLLDTADPTRHVPLTAFATAPTLVEHPAWSRRGDVLAFASNVGNGLRSLEEESIYAIDADGTNLRPLTGFGLLGDLPGPTGVVVGRVLAPTLAIGTRSVVPSTSACIVSAQGTSVTASCESDGAFRLAGVPVGSAWLRAQADVEYFDAVLGLGAGPGLSWGFTPIDVRAGETTNAGTIELAPAIEKSIYPSWAPGDGRLVASDRVRAMGLRQDPDTYAWQWTPTRGGTLVVWDPSGATGPSAVVLPGATDVADLSGGDWSPVAGRIACAANGTIGGRSGSFVLLIDPDGGNPEIVYETPLSPFDPILRLVLQARWSPDGRRLAVVESATDAYDPSRGRSEVLVMNADGGDARALTASAWGEYAGTPSWSPDGEALAYHVALMPSLFTMIVERSDLVAVRADGTGRVALSSDGRSSQPAWRSGTLTPPPPPPPRCAADGECDDGDRCTADRCDAGTCVSRATGGFDGAQCLIARLGESPCAAGLPDALRRFIDGRMTRALRALDAAATAGTPRRRAKLVRRADARLAQIVRRATKLAARKKRPLDPTCRDRIVTDVTDARGVVADLAG